MGDQGLPPDRGRPDALIRRHLLDGVPYRFRPGCRQPHGQSHLHQPPCDEPLVPARGATIIGTPRAIPSSAEFIPAWGQEHGRVPQQRRLRHAITLSGHGSKTVGRPVRWPSRHATACPRTLGPPTACRSTEPGISGLGYSIQPNRCEARTITVSVRPRVSGCAPPPDLLRCGTGGCTPSAKVPTGRGSRPIRVGAASALASPEVGDARTDEVDAEASRDDDDDRAAVFRQPCVHRGDAVDRAVGPDGVRDDRDLDQQ